MKEEEKNDDPHPKDPVSEEDLLSSQLNFLWACQGLRSLEQELDPRQSSLVVGRIYSQWVSNGNKLGLGVDTLLDIIQALLSTICPPTKRNYQSHLAILQNILERRVQRDVCQVLVEKGRCRCQQSVAKAVVHNHHHRSSVIIINEDDGMPIESRMMINKARFSALNTKVSGEELVKEVSRRLEAIKDKKIA